MENTIKSALQAEANRVSFEQAKRIEAERYHAVKEKEERNK